MTNLREIMLARAKAPAKVHSMERVPPGAKVAEPEPAPAPEPKKAVPEAPRPAEVTRRPLKASERRRQRAAVAAAARPVAQEVAVQTSTSSDAGVQAGGPESEEEEEEEPLAVGPGVHIAALQAGTPALVLEAELDEPHQRRGPRSKVPAYLRRRQAEAAEELRRAAKPPEPKPPPGFRRVPEQERLDALEVLKKQQAEAQEALRKLPFVIETAGQRRREKDLSSRAASLEKLLGMFKSPLVFVPEDSEPIVPKREPPRGILVREREKPSVELPSLPLIRNPGAKSFELQEPPVHRLQQPPGGRSRLVLY